MTARTAPEIYDRPIDGGSYELLPNGRVKRLEPTTAPAPGKSAARTAPPPAPTETAPPSDG